MKIALYIAIAIVASVFGFVTSFIWGGSVTRPLAVLSIVVGIGLIGIGVIRRKAPNR